MNSREEFEDHVCKVTNARNFTIREEDGEYASERVQDMFLIWQAARAQGGQGAEPVAAKEFWRKLNPFVDEYIKGYEYRGDAGDYHPSDKERGLIEDCVAGLLYDMQAEGFLNTHPQPAQQGSTHAPTDDRVQRVMQMPLKELAAKFIEATDRASRNMDALKSAQQGSVPEGWKLVPVEPTTDMRYAYHEAEQRYLEGSIPSPDGQWWAMLDAAPQPPQEGEGDEQ